MECPFFAFKLVDGFVSGEESNSGLGLRQVVVCTTTAGCCSASSRSSTMTGLLLVFWGEGEPRCSTTCVLLLEDGVVFPRSVEEGDDDDKDEDFVGDSQVVCPAGTWLLSPAD